MNDGIKTLTEIESKDYTIKLQENEIFELKKKLQKHHNFLLISIYTIFPLAISGLLFIATWENFKFFLIMIPVLIIVALPLGLLGWLLKKIRN